MTVLAVLLLFCCFIALAGCWVMLADIRSELRAAVREYERGMAKDVRARVQ